MGGLPDVAYIVQEPRPLGPRTGRRPPRSEGPHQAEGRMSEQREFTVKPADAPRDDTGASPSRTSRRMIDCTPAAPTTGRPVGRGRGVIREARPFRAGSKWNDA